MGRSLGTRRNARTCLGQRLCGPASRFDHRALPTVYARARSRRRAARRQATASVALWDGRRATEGGPPRALRTLEPEEDAMRAEQDPSGTTGAALTCKVAVRGTTHVISLAGEIDPEPVPRLRRAIEQVFEARAATLVTDLAGVTFMDSSGMHILLEAQERARAGGVRFVMVPAADHVLGPFRRAGIDGLSDAAAPG